MLGLHALILLTDARRATRLSQDGQLVPLSEQDRSRWRHDDIATGVAEVEAALRRGATGEIT